MSKTIQAVKMADTLKLHIPQLDRMEETLLDWTKRDEMFQALVIKATLGGIPIFEGVYGTNTKEGGVRIDTIFPVASNTKPIIAALLMILEEEGKLDLSEPVCRFLPEYVTNGRKIIQLWHFLTHTSGINDEELNCGSHTYIKERFGLEKPGDNPTEEEWNQYWSRVKQELELPADCEWNKMRDTLSLCVELKHKPRELMLYCNHGYQKLKDVICRITGENIDTAAQRMLFEPLGMKDSYWVVPKEKWSRILGRNERCMGYPWINTEDNYTNESGSGGLKTTVGDMARFCEMILGEGRYNNHRILSPASIRAMTSNYNAALQNSWASWGLGWNYCGVKVDDTGMLCSKRALDHGGWAGHKILVDPEYGLSVICYSAVYNTSTAQYFTRINNMIIAAID